MGTPFLGAEELILLGVEEGTVPIRSRTPKSRSAPAAGCRARFEGNRAMTMTTALKFAWTASEVDETPGAEDAAAIGACLLDYFDGWFDGDPVRMDRALHPALVKMSIGNGPDRSEVPDVDTKETMVEATKQGYGRLRDLPDRGIRIEITAFSGNIASAVVRSAVYVDFVLLYRTRDEGWKITQALWHWAPGNGPRAI